MIQKLFPRGYNHYLSLKVLGPVASDFAVWLLDHGFTMGSARFDLRALRSIDHQLRKQGHNRIQDVTREELNICSNRVGRKNYINGCIVHTLGRFLSDKDLLKESVPARPGPSELLLVEYADFLKDIRGLEDKTIRNHVATVFSFLDQLSYEKDPSRLERIKIGDIETFLKVSGRTNSRTSLQHIVGHLRAFLKFTAMQGASPSGLQTQIDTPRLYRLEQLPKSLPWQTVKRFLKAIDKTTELGLRDYTMFFLILTYGLRASEVVTLTLDDILWQSSCIRVPQNKTKSELFLPLTDEAASILIRYIRRARPSLPYRQLFLRARAPYGVLKPTAVSDAAKRWFRHGGLNIPGKGVHWLRHSYAVHLLRQGVSVKVIGDVLGHRNAESTSVYLRLATDDLRDVPLDLPFEKNNRITKEDRR
ncbi:site-specific integrase [bacterium]|nr:site-specific integrase [bacterium]